jgi:hypothetical protein
LGVRVGPSDRPPLARPPHIQPARRCRFPNTLRQSATGRTRSHIHSCRN